MHMKRLSLCLLAALALVSFGTHAAESTGPKKGPLDRYLAQISERLNLSVDQEKRIRPILAASMVATMSALKDRNDNKVTEQDRDDPFAEGKVIRNERKLGEEMREIRTDTRESLADILTPQQMAEYHKMRDEDRERTRERVRSSRY